MLNLKKYFFCISLILIIFLFFYFLLNISNYQKIKIYKNNNALLIGDIGNKTDFQITVSTSTKNNLLESISKEIYSTLEVKNNSITFNKIISNLNNHVFYNLSDNTVLESNYLNGNINFAIPSYDFINDLNLHTIFPLTNVAEIRDIPRNSLVAVGSNKIIDTTQTDNGLISIKDLLNKKINVYTSKRANLLNNFNSSFENGLWTSNAQDCSNSLPGNADISLSLSKDSTDGKNSLSINSNNHHACTFKGFSLELNSNNLYRFSFDYKNIEGNKVNYYLKFTNNLGDTEEHSEIFDAYTSSWTKYQIIFKPRLDNIKTVDIYLYAPSDGSEVVKNLYDNLRIEEYIPNSNNNYTVESTSTNVNYSLSSNIDTLKYVPNNINLLVNNNFSFETGLWLKQPLDCSNSYPGEPNISAKISNNSTDGTSSLDLFSSNHSACEFNSFPVQMNEDKLYKFSFDYKNIKGNAVQFYINLRNKYDKNQDYSEKIVPNNNVWNHYETVIDPRINDINSIDVYFYALSDGTRDIENLYDNVSLQEYLPKNIKNYLFHATQDLNDIKKFSAIEYKNINIFQSVLTIHGASDIFLLDYSEAFSQNWKLYLSKNTENLESVVPDDYNVQPDEVDREANKEELANYVTNNLVSKVGNKFVSKNFNGSIQNDNLDNPSIFATLRLHSLDESNHFKINNYENAWLIDVKTLCATGNCIENLDGTYDISFIIENKWNKILNIGLLISGTTLFACLSYLGYAGIQSIRKRII